jgi:hypothetical protein
MPDARAASVDLYRLTKGLAEGELIDVPAGSPIRYQTAA